MNTKEDILKKIVNQTIISYYGSQWGPTTVWLPTFFKFFCVQQEKEIHTGLKQFPFLK